MIIGIAAIAKNYAIGKDGKLPWHYSADLKFFKQTTSGNVAVMGLHTWQSIGKPLPNRLNIVLSRSAEIENQPSVIVLRSKEAVLELAKFVKGDVFLIGGAKTYAEFAGVIEKWIVTEIPETIADADAFMPENFLANFAETNVVEIGDGLRVKFYERK
jgi:dihydrofolate reductase